MRGKSQERLRVEGFTLVELLISMVIGLILLTAVYSVFISSSDSYKRLEGLASIQERGRIAINLLQGLTQAADYTGCRSSVSINVGLSTAGTYEYNFGQGIQGFNSTGTGWSPTLPTGSPAPIPSPLAAGGDILTIRGPVGNPVKLSSAMASSSSVLAVPAGSPFVQNDIIMISNCAGGADVFQKTNAGGAAVTSIAHSGGSNITGNLGAVYGSEAMLVKVATVSLFVRTNANGIRSLWWKEGTANAQEILEGVEAMEILYGITTSTDTSANQYLTANAVTNWSDVVSIRVALLVATERPVLRAPQTSSYNLLGTTYSFTDNRLRRMFETNIVLRNRSF